MHKQNNIRKITVVDYVYLYLQPGFLKYLLRNMIIRYTCTYAHLEACTCSTEGVHMLKFRCTYAHLRTCTCSTERVHMIRCVCTHSHLTVCTCSTGSVHMLKCRCAYAHLQACTCSTGSVHMLKCVCACWKDATIFFTFPPCANLEINCSSTTQTPKHWIQTWKKRQFFSLQPKMHKNFS